MNGSVSFLLLLLLERLLLILSQLRFRHEVSEVPLETGDLLMVHYTLLLKVTQTDVELVLVLA